MKEETSWMETPLYSMMGKILDVLILSVLFWVSCIPVFTAGASLSALYVNCLKIAEDRQSYVFQGFFRAFRNHFKRATSAWLVMLGIGIGLAIDGYYCIFGKGFWSYAFRWAFLVLLAAYLAVFTYLFPLAARCIVSTKRLFVMSYVMALKELPKTILMIGISISCIAFGLFVYQPAVIAAPGIIALIHSYLFKQIFKKYHLDIPEPEREEDGNIEETGENQ